MTLQMIAGSVKEKLRASRSLPSLPAVAIELIRLCRDEEVDLVKISARLEQDPALAARLMRVANSAFYSGGGEVKTLHRAVSMLGANSVMTLALSFSLVVTVRGQRGFDHDGFWRRALLSGIAGRCLAPGAGLEPDELFLAALFQDLGILAIHAAWPTEYAMVASESGGDHARLERREAEYLQVSHPEVGALLAEEWNLPAYIAVAALASHDLRRSPTDTRLRLLCNCVALSGMVADVWCGPNPVKASRDAGAQAAELLSIDGNEFWELLSKVADEFAQVSALFEVRLDSESKVAEVLDQAKEALVSVSLRSARSAASSESAVVALAREKRAMEERLQRDALTGLFGREHAAATLRLAMAGAIEYGRPAGVLVCDLDAFKAVNEAHGHLAGDRVLVAVAQALVSAVRRTGDVVGRWGGEAFVVVLPGTDLPGVLAVAERMRAAVAALAIGTDAGQPLQVTVSIGAAVQNPGDVATVADALFAQADARLHKAKALGRNRVVGEGP